MTGRIHSFQSLGATDGPGVRFVVFMQGCGLRCGYCHNPDTWDLNGGNEFEPYEVVEKVKRYKEYFGKDGGVTVSGGEPLLQTEFVTEVFRLCHESGINTCLDTSGFRTGIEVERLLEYTDRVLLDIKFTNDGDYRRYVGMPISVPLEFLELSNSLGVPVWLRQVIVPTLNDNEQNARLLRNLRDRYSCVEKVELLPFRKICSVKYDNMGIEFPFAKYDVPDKQTLDGLYEILRT